MLKKLNKLMKCIIATRKFIPIEIIALYYVIQDILEPGFCFGLSINTARYAVLAAGLCLVIFLTILLAKGEGKEDRRKHYKKILFFSIISYLAWTYIFGWAFILMGIYDKYLGFFLLFLWTIILTISQAQKK